MEGKGNFFNIVLLLIVAFLTLTLAALAGYVFLGGGSKSTATVVQTVDKTIPKDAELESLQLYEGKSKYFNLKADETKAPNVLSVIQVNVELKYFKKSPKGSSIKDPKLKMDTYAAEVKQLVGTYFMNLTLEEVKKADAKEKAAEELKKRINELLNENEKDKKDLVYKITFDEWFYT